MILRLIGLFAFLGVAWLSLAPDPLPTPALRKFFGGYDHLLMFTVFAAICFVVWPKDRLQVAVWLLVIAVGLETIQLILPARAFGLTDLLANLAGVGLGAMLTYILYRSRAH